MNTEELITFCKDRIEEYQKSQLGILFDYLFLCRQYSEEDERKSDLMSSLQYNQGTIEELKFILTQFR